MKAISIGQPWAWLIVNGHKDIENRDWPTAFRGRILIHAGQTMRLKSDYREAAKFAARLGVEVPHPAELARGGIVGVATITDCVQSHRSPWFVGWYGFVLAEPMPLPFVESSGRLKIFDVEKTVSDQLRKWWITAVSEEKPPCP